MTKMRSTLLVVPLLVVHLALAFATHSITAGVPVLVRETTTPNEYVYFPQTLHWAGKNSLLLSSQSDSDALHDAGWTGFSMGSIDAGQSWSDLHASPDFPWLFKPCVTQQSSGGVDDMICFEYPLRRPQVRRNIVCKLTHLYALDVGS